MKRVFHLITGIFLLAALLVSVSACGGSSGDTSSGGTETVPPGQNATVSAKNLKFSPSDLTVTKGTTVTWSNEDTVNHTVTSKDKIFDSGTMTPGQNFGYTFNEVGTFDYFCTIHASMTGKITVTE